MQYLCESSFNDLYNSAVKAFPRTTKRQHATQPIIIEQLRFTPFIGLRTLFIKSEARNEDRQYNTMVLFKNLNYNEDGVKIIASDGIPYTFEKLSLENTDVLLRCGCPDWRWRFAHYNKLDKSLYGKEPPKYESKGVGPPANPMQLPGACKHLMRLFEVLSDNGLFVD